MRQHQNVALRFNSMNMNHGNPVYASTYTQTMPARVSAALRATNESMKPEDTTDDRKQQKGRRTKRVRDK